MTIENCKQNTTLKLFNASLNFRLRLMFGKFFIFLNKFLPQYSCRVYSYHDTLQWLRIILNISSRKSWPMIRHSFTCPSAILWECLIEQNFVVKISMKSWLSDKKFVREKIFVWPKFCQTKNIVRRIFVEMF